MASSFSPDKYVDLVRFLTGPLLNAPEALSVDCETYSDQGKIWIRLACDSGDQERLVGYKGRTLQAIRRVVDIAAKLAGQKVQIEVYGAPRESPRSGAGSSPRSGGAPRRTPSRRPRRRD
ncbi:KH domain-containing protein [Lyngbya confervoides]|uniref:KH domain-containing protein n=1 Tax=Lyngbya confervoides BDU141951 TaxID=1574623 RepID=A0ABD4T274_9CYAN|nr:KH domain-containing protein [Lyngbya confervoides]MCM1982749.1 KH domain-containing protein [Lyngbya confervoides BDU141951]